MSSKSTGAGVGAIVLGVAIGVLAIMFPPAGAGFFFYASAMLGAASLVAGGAMGIAFQPQAMNPQSAKAQDVQFANAGEGFPVPVIFGEQKVVPNFMNWRADQFFSKSVSQAAGGKGGGGSGVSGFNYFLTFELGLCMGPIDEIGQVVSVPGDVLSRGKQYSAANGATATQSTVVVVASKDVFSSDQVGATLLWADGTVDIITFVTDSKHANVASSRTVSPAQTFSIFSTPSQIVFSDSDNATFATGTLTASGPSSGDTVTLGGVVYRMRSSGAGLVQANDVLIGATSTISMTNLKDAINRTGTPGTQYHASTLVNPKASAATVGAVLTATSLLPGSDGNAVDTTASAGLRLVWGAPTLLGGTSNEYREFNLTGINEGGLVRLYRGSETQVRASASDPYVDTGMYYRNICWGLFIKFKINKNVPTPKTYQFILRRFSRAIRDDGTTVTGLHMERGSDNVVDPAYYQTNPASAIYEIITNKLWGRRSSSDIIDEASFITCATYFKSKNIGISFTLDSPEKLSTTLDSIRTHLKTVLLWRNGKWVLKCLLDPAQTSGTILTLTSDDIEDLQIARPLWPTTLNEIRCEFNNKNKLYKGDIVPLKNLANIRVTGRVNPQHLALRAFTDFNICARQVARIMAEVSFPAMTAGGYINRFKSNVEIGDVVRIIWKEWGANTVTAYFMIQKLIPQGKKDDRIKFSAMEDVFLCPVEGEETSVSLPGEMGWERIANFALADIHLFQNPDSNAGEIFPVMALELPAILTLGGFHRALVLGQAPSPGTVDMQVSWAKKTSTNYTAVTGTPTFAATGQLLTAIVDSIPTNRRTSFFDFSLTNVNDEATVLAANQVVSDADNLEVLPAAAIQFIVMGEEIIYVGSITKVGPNQYRARNVIRGAFGTPITTHIIGEVFFFVDDLNDGYATTAVPVDQIIKFRAYPITVNGVNPIGDDFFTVHAVPDNQEYLALGIRPLAPEPIGAPAFVPNSGGVNDDEWRCTIRPRFYNHGAGTGALLGVYNSSTNRTNGIIQQLVSSLGGMSFLADVYDVDNNFLTTFTIDATDTVFTPEAFSSKYAGGRCTVDVPAYYVRTFGSGQQTLIEVKRIEIRSLYLNKRSVRAAHFVTP